MAKFKNGVNPQLLAQWKAEDKQERMQALEELFSALWKMERLYEVADESGHPLDKAYEIIFNWGDGEGLIPE